ncbi:hypothetical protein BH23ACT12_BH23ACT12_07880 [soil metagenome]
MVKLGTLLSAFKAWSNFRLMLVVGSLVTILSLGLGAIVVQAALSDGEEPQSPVAGVSRSTANGGEEVPAEQEITGPEAPGTAGSQTSTENRLPVLENNSDFRISCLTGDPRRTQNTCQVESFGGFSQRVNLSCADLPANLSCSFVPASVVPRANGSTPFRIELSAGNIPAGSYNFEVVGRSGNKVSRILYPWGVAPPSVAVARPPAPGAPRPAPAEPTFSFTCGSLSDGNKLLWSLAKDGPNVKINCFLTPLNGFNEAVKFEYSLAADLAKPNTVAFILDQLQAKKLFDLSFEMSDEVRNLSDAQLEQGVDYAIDVIGTSATGKSLTRTVTLTVKK